MIAALQTIALLALAIIASVLMLLLNYGLPTSLLGELALIVIAEAAFYGVLISNHMGSSWLPKANPMVLFWSTTILCISTSPMILEAESFVDGLHTVISIVVSVSVLVWAYRNKQSTIIAEH
jgi:hypothetical protein